MTYRTMDDSIHLHDVNYGGPSPTSSQVERFNSSALPSDNHSFGSHTFGDTLFSFNTPSFDTVSPSSLDLYHKSHDDSCVDKCVGSLTTQGAQRGMLPPSYNTRPRFTPYLPYQLPESNGFQVQPQAFNNLYQDPFPNLGLRYGPNHGSRSIQNVSNNQLLMGNNFNTADLGVSQYPASEDCASIICSNISCPSDCCSTQVCQGEACSGDGTPCDDLECLTDDASEPLDHIWAMNTAIDQGWSPDVNSPLHDQPCNHTHTEHDVAITLRDLRAPGSTNVPQQQQLALPAYNCNLIEAPTHPVDPTSQLALHARPYSSLSSTTDLDSVPPPLDEGAKAPEMVNQFVCQWKFTSEPGVQEQICGHICSDAASLHEHICNDHVSLLTSKTKFLCAWDGCCRESGRSFPSGNKLSRHIATHSKYKPFVCEFCGGNFSAHQALEQHVRTHTGEKPYKCDKEGCPWSFKQKSALLMHKRTHTGEKPLQCETCGKRFSESSNLSKHRKTHNPDPKYACDEPGCTSKFIRIDQLRRHKTRHETQKKKRALRALSPTPATPPDIPQEPLPSLPMEQAASV
ncbi:hypothetical protein F4818DRAFT_401254 [Hypoxylon cercidicola]|nr:hypothetical protein F4818DRAFT_401254 [Hypoxylon cercidicola]